MASLAAFLGCSEETSLKQVRHALEVSVFGEGAVAMSPPERSCESVCEEAYLDRTIVTLTATPAMGSVFLEWSDDCDSEPTETCLVLMDRGRRASATFFPDEGAEPRITVLIAGDGRGTVTSTPAGIACPGDCREDFDLGESVTLTARAERTSRFDGWGGDCAGQTGAICTVAVDRSKNVIATFSPLAPNETRALDIDFPGRGTGVVTVSPGGETCSSDCLLQLPLGAEITITAAPMPGSRFSGFGGDCRGQEGAPARARAWP